jgi:hypothetical protein
MELILTQRTFIVANIGRRVDCRDETRAKTEGDRFSKWISKYV